MGLTRVTDQEIDFGGPKVFFIDPYQDLAGSGVGPNFPNALPGPDNLLSGHLEGEFDKLPHAVCFAGGQNVVVGFRLLHQVKPGGLGYGDVRLAPVLGLHLGWLGWGYLPFGLFAGFLYGAVFGIALLAIRGSRARRTPVPFGPFLAAGTMTFVLVGAPILDWYAGLGA